MMRKKSASYIIPYGGIPLSPHVFYRRALQFALWTRMFHTFAVNYNVALWLLELKLIDGKFDEGTLHGKCEKLTQDRMPAPDSQAQHVNDLMQKRTKPKDC